jgi:hypothetical protein
MFHGKRLTPFDRASFFQDGNLPVLRQNVSTLFRTGTQGPSYAEDQPPKKVCGALWASPLPLQCTSSDFGRVGGQALNHKINKDGVAESAVAAKHVGSLHPLF